MRFRKKPVVIEAVQLLPKNWKEICEFANVGKLIEGKPEGYYIDEEGAAAKTITNKIGLAIPTKEGLMMAWEGDWIIRGVAGELYPCKPDIFEKTYERVEE